MPLPASSRRHEPTHGIRRARTDLPFSARDACRPAAELLARVTATEGWEGFPEAELREAIDAGGESSFERSLKLEGAQLHPLRFNYYYRERPRHALDRWVGLHDAVRRTFPLPRVDPGGRLDDVLQVVAGIDFRATPRSSRLKLWFETSVASELLREALGRSGLEDHLLLDDRAGTILWGYDLGLCGARTFKIYPRICGEQLTGFEESVATAMPRHLRSLIEHCRRVYMVVREGEEGRSFHFLPHSMPGFLRRLGSERLLRVVRDLRLEERAVIVSIPGSDESTGDLDSCALYYRDR